MKNFRMAVAAFAIAAASFQGCSCDPLVPNPDGGMTGGGGGGETGGGAGGGGATGGGTGGGATGGGMGTGGGGEVGGGAGGGTGGGTGGGATGGGGGEMDGGLTQFTEYARTLIVNGTNDTTAARPAAEFTGLPDDAPRTFSPDFFDGGTQ